jgi:hypothetical protein
MIIIIIAVIITAYLMYKFFGDTIGKRIEIDMSRNVVYGWYYGEILASKRFRYNYTAEEVLKAKELVKIELNRKIKIYKEIHK